MKEILTGLCLIGAAVAVTALCVVGAIWGVDRMERPYYEACRDAGDVVVSNGDSLNCARPDGGWIDVR
jgi:hypothetical protein